MIRRRAFITLIGGGAVAWPLAARAQASPKGPTIAWIGTSPQLNASFIENFLRGMRKLGYAEGRNFEMLYRFTDGYQERLPALTEEVTTAGRSPCSATPRPKGSGTSSPCRSTVAVSSPARARALARPSRGLSPWKGRAW